MKPISFKEAQDVEFVKAHICGADGLIPSVHLDESTLPKKVFPYYIKIDGEKAIIEMPEVAEDKENSYMFITYRDDLLPDESKSLRYPKWLFQISTRKVKWRGVTASLRRSRRIYEYWESGEYLIKEKPPEPDFKIAGILVNDVIVEVLFSNSVDEDDDNYGGYKYYVACGDKDTTHPVPNVVAIDAYEYITFGTIISPFPIYMMDGITKLVSFNVREDNGIYKKEAYRWISRKISDFNIHEERILQMIDEIASGLKDADSYAVANMLKSTIGNGRGLICITEDLTYVWTNIVTARSYDINGRRTGFMVPMSEDMDRESISKEEYESLVESSIGKFPNL